MARLYEVLFYNGWQEAPAYYLLDGVEGRTPREALRKNLPRVIQEVRELFGLDEDIEDDKICETLYALKSDALVPAWRILDEQWSPPT